MIATIRRLHDHRVALITALPSAAGVKRFFIRLKIFLTDVCLTFCQVPLVFTSTVQESFQKTARTSPTGAFIDSYVLHQRFYQRAVGSAVMAVLLAALQISSVIVISVFSFGRPQPTLAATINISGTVYLSNETTAATTGNGGFCDGSTANLSLRVNGGTAATTTCSNSDGTYSFTGITANAGDTVTIYSTATAKANRIYVSDATDDAGMNLYIDTVIVADENDGMLTALDLLDYDNDENAGDMLFDADDAAPDTLSVESTIELHVWAGDTFDPEADVTVATDLHVPSTATLTIDSGFTVTLAATSGTALTLAGAISGAGTLVYSTSTSFPSGGTISSILRMDATDTNQTISGRTIGGQLEIVSSSNSADRTVTYAGGTIQSNLYVSANGANNLTFNGGNSSATMTVNGDFDFLGTGSGSEVVYLPNFAFWYLAGDVDFSGGSFTASGSIPEIDLVGSGGQSFNGNGGDMASGYLRINSPTNDPITITGGDFTTGYLIVNASDTLTLGTGAAMTVKYTLTLNGTINGAGTLVYQYSTAFPTTGTIGSVLRMDATGANQILSARTYGGAVEVYNNSSTNARTVTLGTAGSQTLTFSSHLNLNTANTQNLTLQGATWDPTLNINGNLSVTGSGGGTEIITAPDAAATWTVGGNIDLDNGTWTSSAESIVMNGTSGNTLEGGGQTILNLTINPASAATITLQTSDLTVSNTLLVETDDALSIAAGRTLTHAGTTLTLNGTISGAGMLVYTSATAFPASGTMSAVLRMDATNGDQVLSARTYGAVEAYNNSGASARTVTLGTAASQTLTVSGDLTLNAANTQSVQLAGDLNNPTINVTGDLDFTGSGGGSEVLTTGTGTWTVSGSVDFTGGSATLAAGNTLVMNGSSKTLTSADQTLQNVTLSGSITLANATHTVSGNLSMAGGTITAGTSSVTMNGTSNTLSGGGNTLNNLTIDPSSAGVITLQTSDMTVGGILNIASGDTLSLSAGRTLTHSGATLTLNGTISGVGTFAYQSPTAFPTTGTVSARLRMDATNNDQSVSARTYGGNVEAYSNSASVARTVTLAAGTHSIGGNLTVNAANTQNVTLSGTNDPTVDIAGNLDFTGEGGGTEGIITGVGTWTVSGNADFSDGTPTITSGNTFYLNGSGGLQEIIPKGHAGVTFSILRIGASEDVAMSNSTATTVTIDSGGCLLSQDHGATDGRLNVYGACNSRSNEYWSYATDFDGTALGAPRQADVRFAPDASFTVDSGDALTILGQSASATRTAVTRQSTGNFAVTVNGTINAQYFDFDYLDASGLNIASTADVLNLSSGSFDNIASGASASYITVSGISSTATLAYLLFDSTGDGTDANAVNNISADGSGIAWTISGASGIRAGESYDREVNGASVLWAAATVTVNDGTGADSDVTNSTTSLSANWSVSDAGGIASYSYAIGTNSGGTQVADFTSAGASTSVTRTGLTLTDGITYFITVRALDSGGDLMAAGVSDGSVVDAVAPTFSAVAVSETATTLTITWTTSEAATTKVKYGLTASYGSETTEDSNRATNHTTTISGLTAGATYHFQLLGTDQAGNVATSGDQTIATSALEATVITNTTATAQSSTSVKIAWTTNHPADSKVRYGKTTAFGLEKHDPTLVTSHEITLADLEVGTLYYYEVLSVGNSSTNDATATFTTTADAPANLPGEPAPAAEVSTPTILSPSEGASFPEKTTIRIIGLAGSGQTVTIFIDDVWAGAVTARTTSTGTGDWVFNLKTSLAPGTHVLTVQGSKGGATSSRSLARTMTVVARVISPTALPPIVRGGDDPSITIRGLVPSGASVAVLVDGKEVKRLRPQLSATGTSSFAFTIDPDAYRPGKHRVTVAAYNLSGVASKPKTVATFTRTKQSVTPASPHGLDYVVKRGDSLWTIAREFLDDGRNYPKLIKANLRRYPSLLHAPSILRVGWTLTIPS